MASSSAEADYVALADCMKGALFLRIPLELLLPDSPKMRVKISEDNEGSLKFTTKPIWRIRSKDSDVLRNFLREIVEQGKKIDMVHMPVLNCR